MLVWHDAIHAIQAVTKHGTCIQKGGIVNTFVEKAELNSCHCIHCCCMLLQNWYLDCFYKSEAQSGKKAATYVHE